MRDLQRENRKGQFSWMGFLRAEREKKRKPYLIEDEETFQKRLEEDQRKFLFNGTVTHASSYINTHSLL